MGQGGDDEQVSGVAFFAQGSPGFGQGLLVETVAQVDLCQLRMGGAVGPALRVVDDEDTEQSGAAEQIPGHQYS